MNRRLTVTTLMAATLLLVSAHAGAERRGQVVKPTRRTDCKQVFRPNQPRPNVRPSHAMPKIQKPAAKVTTWGIETTWQPVQTTAGSRAVNRDPYKVEMTGYNEGTKITVKTQERSGDVTLPTATCPGCDKPSKGKKVTNPRKLARKERSKAWQQSVSKAQNWNTLQETTTPVASYKETHTVESANVLPTHTPVKVTAKDPFGRTYATVNTHAQGLPTQNQNTDRLVTDRGRNVRQNGVISRSGLHVPGYETWANTKNFYVTPAYGEGGQEQVKLLGLAAFPAGSKITVTNLRLQSEGAGAHSVVFTANKSGSGGIAVPGLQNDKLRVTVSFDGVANQSQASSHSFEVRVPRASGRPAIKSRGIQYYAATLAE